MRAKEKRRNEKSAGEDWPCAWQAFEREGKGNFSFAHIPLHFFFERLPRRLGEVQKTTGNTIFLSSPFIIPLIIER